MEKLKVVLTFVGAFTLRLALVAWVTLMLRLMFVNVLGEVTLLHAVFVLVLTILLHFTKVDSRFLIQHMNKRKFYLAIYAGYSLLWVRCLADYFVGNVGIPGYGLGLLFLTLLIAPISEVMLVFLWGWIDAILKWVNAAYPSLAVEKLYIHLIIEISCSFIVLHLLLRFIRWCVSRFAQAKS
jgi:hypothetical protein